MSFCFKPTRYLGFKHGSTVHRVCCCSSLPLLSFALNFCDLKKRTRLKVRNHLWTLLEENCCNQWFTFQVVVCYQAQGHHESQFLGKKQQVHGWSLNAAPAGTFIQYLWVLLFLRPGRKRRRRRWQRRGGWRRDGHNRLLLCSISRFNRLLIGEDPRIETSRKNSFTLQLL